MSARSWHNDAQSTGQGVVYLDFSFLTNGTSSPTITYSNQVPAGTARGEGVASVVRAAAGRFTVVLQDGYKAVVSKSVDLEDFASGSDDGAYATVGPVTGEGLGNSNALSFDVFTRAAAGTKTDYGTGGTGTPRRVSIMLCLKNSGTGR